VGVGVGVGLSHRLLSLLPLGLKPSVNVLDEFPLALHRISVVLQSQQQRLCLGEDLEKAIELILSGCWKTSDSPRGLGH
jgi:hypothetical protein